MLITSISFVLAATVLAKRSAPEAFIRVRVLKVLDTLPPVFTGLLMKGDRLVVIGVHPKNAFLLQAEVPKFCLESLILALSYLKVSSLRSSI